MSRPENLEGAVDSHASGIGGWSKDRKQYVETWYNTDGSSRTIRYSFGKQKGDWTGKIKAVDGDGRKGTGKVYLRASSNEFSGGSTGTTNGEKTEVKYICQKK